MVLGCLLSPGLSGPVPSLLSAALGCFVSSSGSIERLISPLEGICQHELGLSGLSLGLKAQTGSGPGGADSGLAPWGMKERPPAETTGVSQNDCHVSRGTAKATVVPKILPSI